MKFTGFRPCNHRAIRRLMAAHYVVSIAYYRSADGFVIRFTYQIVPINSLFVYLVKWVSSADGSQVMNQLPIN